MQANPRLTALIAFLSQEFINLVCRVLLLAWQVGILGQQRVGTFTIGTKDRCWLRFAQSVGLGWPILNGFINRFAGMSLLTGDLSLALLFKVVSPTNGFVFFHGNHLQFSYR